MESEFVTMAEAAKMLGLSKATMWRRAKSGEIRVFESQVDRRRKLIRLEDVQALMQPVELEEGKAAA